jgi:hypothetical protein
MFLQLWYPCLSEGLVFELLRTETAADIVASPVIVITLDIIKHRGPHYFTAGKTLSADTLHLQRVKKLSAQVSS